MAPSISTIGRKSSSASASTINNHQQTQQSHVHADDGEDSDSLGEYADGTATLAAQNRALQADLADKTRYCQTLEKRLLQARRSSHSRTSAGFSTPNKGVLVGEDHGVASLLREKDSEIADLRARLEDKDRMLDALRSAARSRDVAERDPRASHSLSLKFGDANGQNSPLSPVSARTSQLLAEREAAAAIAAGGNVCLGANMGGNMDRSVSVNGIAGVGGELKVKKKERTKSVDEVSRLLDEMMQERVERGGNGKGGRVSGEGLDLGVAGENAVRTSL